MNQIQEFEDLASLVGVGYVGDCVHEGSSKIAVVCESAYQYDMFCVELYANGLGRIAYAKPVEQPVLTGPERVYAWDKAIFNEERG
jgi:hypothetical protein